MDRERRENSKPRKGKPSIGTIRHLVFGLVFVIVAISLVLHTGMGTPSAFGLDWISSVCPLGMLETVVTGRNFGIHALILLAVALVLIVIFGKAFCSWICPTTFIQRFFSRKSLQRTSETAMEDSEKPVVESRHIVLVGTLLSSALFGFPVFCLVCPVGLTFATFIALWHLFQFNELTWSLLVFPLIVIAEIVFFKKWCSKICPIGALLSIVSRLNRTFKPRVDPSSCLRMNGNDCKRCETVCPESIDPHDTAIPECTKCGACIDACPAQAISLKLYVPNEPQIEKTTEKER